MFDVLDLRASLQVQLLDKLQGSITLGPMMSASE
jgi:hypothetical protein